MGAKPREAPGIKSGATASGSSRSRRGSRRNHGRRRVCASTRHTINSLRSQLPFLREPGVWLCSVPRPQGGDPSRSLSPLSAQGDVLGPSVPPHVRDALMGRVHRPREADGLRAAAVLTRPRVINPPLPVVPCGPCGGNVPSDTSSAGMPLFPRENKQGPDLPAVLRLQPSFQNG